VFKWFAHRDARTTRATGRRLVETRSGIRQVTTAWVVAESDLPVPPSQHPDRVEAVVLSVVDSRRYEVWFAPIERSEDASPQLGEWTKTKAVTGLFVESLRRAVCHQG
jgi:hypothetical protein